MTVEPPALRRVAPLGVALSNRGLPALAVRAGPGAPSGPTWPLTRYLTGRRTSGLVAFRLCACGEFLEVNAWTYSLDQRGRRGVVFLSMEANRLAWVLPGRATGLPFAWARQRLVRHVHELRYHSARRWPSPQNLSSHVGIRVGQPIEGGPLDHFLTARWRLHSADVVDLYDDDLILAMELPAPTASPTSVLYAPRVSGRMGLPRRC